MLWFSGLTERRRCACFIHERTALNLCVCAHHSGCSIKVRETQIGFSPQKTFNSSRMCAGQLHHFIRKFVKLLKARHKFKRSILCILCLMQKILRKKLYLMRFPFSNIVRIFLSLAKIIVKCLQVGKWFRFVRRFDCLNAFVMTNSKSFNKSQTIH